MNAYNGRVFAVLAIFVLVLSIVPVGMAKDGGDGRSGSSGSGSGSGRSSGFDRDDEDDDDDRTQENDDGRRGRGRNDDREDKEDDEIEIEDENEREIEIEIEGNLTKVELKLNGTREDFLLNTTNTDDIMRKISNRTGLSVQEVAALAEFKEDDDRDDLIEILRDEDDRDRRRGSNRGRGNSGDEIRIRNRNVEVEGIISNNTSVDINEAIEIAKRLAPGAVDRVEQEVEDGKIVWKIRIFQSNGTRADIRIDAETGNVTRGRFRDVGGFDLSRDFLKNETGGLGNATIEDLRAEVSELRQEVSLLRSLLNRLSRFFGFGG